MADEAASPAFPVKVLYGIIHSHVDATSRTVKPSNFPGRFIFEDPGGDHERLRVISPAGDPARQIVKKLFIYDAATNELLIELPPFVFKYGIHFSSASELVSTLSTFHATPAKLAKIHHRFAKVGFSGNYLEEYHEQLLAAAFIPPTAKVLELGANVGRNTCVIGSILDDPSRLVSFETVHFDACVAKINLNKCGLPGVNVEIAAVSSIRLEQQSWLTRPIPPGQRDASAGWTEVKTIPYARVVAKYGTFDTLVADCEGALLFILRDAPELLDTVKRIIVENDYNDLAHYKEVVMHFINKGFRKVLYMGNLDAPFPTKPYFYEAWVRD